MAAVTAAVVGGATLASQAYSANRQRDAAREAAGRQAEGVENARLDTQAASQAARNALSGGGGGGYQANRADIQQGSVLGNQLIDQGFQQAQQTLSPLADMNQWYMDEQRALLGGSGDQAYQSAVSRISDPMAQQQEQSILRNNAALGGVGGNVLSALAEQNRSRTEANIGNRLGLLGNASAPSLNALQQLSNLQQGRGQALGGSVSGTGLNLANLGQSYTQSLANAELGQGGQLAQLSQNLGTARAGGAAYNAQNAPGIPQAITAGLGAYTGAGGDFSGLSNLFGQSDPYGNRASGYGDIGDPFSTPNAQG